MKESYTAASSFPTKLLHQKVIEDGKIIPIHLQISPTNACNLYCSYCSCEDRDRKKQLSLEQTTQILDMCGKRGTKAVTITGGGEPLMHPQINEIIDYAGKCSANRKGMEIGLVTNGTLLEKLNYNPNLTWCRISSADDRIPAYDSITKAIETNPQTDWAFSHVVTRDPNYHVLGGIINFSNDHNFTHIRLVSDLCDLDNVPSMKEIKKYLRGILTDDSKVIYQGRKDSTRGTKNCYISLLKPVISPEGIFPCCGTQYAIKGQKKDMINKMKMGEIKDLADILDNQRYFDGKDCDVCYYQQYNQVLSTLLTKLEHKNFV